MTRDEEIAHLKAMLADYRQKMRSDAATIRAIRSHLTELRLEKMKEGS